jgi:hypothetical protein
MLAANAPRQVTGERVGRVRPGKRRLAAAQPRSSLALYGWHDLAVPDLRVMADVGDWSAPCVLAALTGVIHDRQGAAGTDHDHREDDQ